MFHILWNVNFCNLRFFQYNLQCSNVASCLRINKCMDSFIYAHVSSYISYLSIKIGEPPEPVRVSHSVEREFCNSRFYFTIEFAVAVTLHPHRVLN